MRFLHFAAAGAAAEETMSENLTTPLHALHLSLGARMVPFAGYDMPLQYPTGILSEHLHTRAAAGLFDVSHMGQVVLRPSRGSWPTPPRRSRGWCRWTRSASTRGGSATGCSPAIAAASSTT